MTIKNSPKKATVRPKKGDQSDRGNEVARLRRQNQKLHGTINDVWSILNEVEPHNSNKAMFDVIDEACHYIITDWPSDYYYDENAESPQRDKSKQQAAMAQAEIDRVRRKLADGLGVDREQLDKTDFNLVLFALRKHVAEEMGLREFPDSNTSPEEYRAIVGFNFIWSVILFASHPCSLKVEAQRYFDAVKEIKASIPQRPRQPGQDVQLALRLLAQGYKWSAIPEKVLPPTLKGVQRRIESRRLRTKVRSLMHTREKRSKTKA